MDPEIARRKDVRDRLLARVRESATSASGSGRSVERPEKVAEYVVNALTLYHQGRLAEAAVVFAYDELGALLGAEGR